MASIKTVLSCLVDCPLANAAAFATRTVKSRQYLLVRIQCDDGHEGIGATYCGDQGGEVCHSAVTSLLGGSLLGRDPFATEALWKEMYQLALLQGRAGSVLRALGALDTALWDHNAKATGLPLWKFFGAYHEGTVPAYASGGYYYGDGEIDKLQRELSEYVSAGFKAVKMKVGRASVSLDRQRVAAAREAIGPEVLLMLDANNAWSDVPTALRFLRALEDFDPFWIEEPFGPDDLPNHIRLAKRTPIAIAGGEIEAGRWRFLEWIQNDGVQIAQPDMFACGGVTEWRRIANLAAGHGVSVCTHAWQDFHAPLMAGVPNALMVEYFVDNRIVNLQRILDKPLVAKDGTMVLSSAPGFGFDFDERAVAETTRIPWTSTSGEARDEAA